MHFFFSFFLFLSCSPSVGNSFFHFFEILSSLEWSDMKSIYVLSHLIGVRFKKLLDFLSPLHL